MTVAMWVTEKATVIVTGSDTDRLSDSNREGNIDSESDWNAAKASDRDGDGDDDDDGENENDINSDWCNNGESEKKLWKRKWP